MTNPWKIYKSRLNAHGASKREVAFKKEVRLLNSKFSDSLSHHNLTINGLEQSLSIINTENLNTKVICSAPGEDIAHGGIVEWQGGHWIITEKDANNEIYTKAKMRQCNYLLRWINESKDIVERWCIVEDGTRFLAGEYGDREYIVNRGDSRVYLYLPKDKETIKLGRQNRFLIDDYGSPNVLAYRLTKPFKFGGSYDQDGVLAFVLSECQTEDTDNFELHIANYYEYFPLNSAEQENMPGTESDGEPDEHGNSHRKKVWL